MVCDGKKRRSCRTQSALKAGRSSKRRSSKGTDDNQGKKGKRETSTAVLKKLLIIYQGSQRNGRVNFGGEKKTRPSAFFFPEYGKKDAWLVLGTPQLEKD